MPRSRARELSFLGEPWLRSLSRGVVLKSSCGISLIRLVRLVGFVPGVLAVARVWDGSLVRGPSPLFR